MYYRLAFLLGAILSVMYGIPGRGSNSPQDAPTVTLSRRSRAGGKSESTSSNLRLAVKVVLVPVTVTDALDKPVTTLPQSSFRLLEDGVEQQITSFSQDDSPVSLGLLFDSSGSMKNRI